MGAKRDHKERIKELEEIRSEVEDTGAVIEIDEAEMQRAVIDGQMVENAKWVTIMEAQVEAREPTYIGKTQVDTKIDDALDDVRERVESLQDAGYMPKMKPLLYYLDFLTMDLKRLREQTEAQTDPVRLEELHVRLHRTEGKIEMTVDWLKAQDTAGNWGSMTLGDKGHEVVLPKFGSKAEVEEAIRTRHMPRHGETEEELIAGRVSRYRQDTDRITQGISEQNKIDKEAEDADST
jgi:hypothetical protein